MTLRIYFAALAFICALFWIAGASAQSVIDPAGCDADHEHNTIVCEPDHFQLLRDKARVGQLVCEALDTGALDVTLPAELLAVCKSASLTSSVWADAQTKDKHKKAAQEAQRAAYQAQGQLKECRASDKLHTQQRDSWRSEAKTESKWRKFWRGTTIGASAAALVGGSLLTCDAISKCPIEF